MTPIDLTQVRRKLTFASPEIFARIRGKLQITSSTMEDWITDKRPLNNEETTNLLAATLDCEVECVEGEFFRISGAPRTTLAARPQPMKIGDADFGNPAVGKMAMPKGCRVTRDHKRPPATDREAIIKSANARKEAEEKAKKKKRIAIPLANAFGGK